MRSASSPAARSKSKARGRWRLTFSIANRAVRTLFGFPRLSDHGIAEVRFMAPRAVHAAKGERPQWVDFRGSMRGLRTAGIGAKPGVRDHAIERRGGVERRG